MSKVIGMSQPEQHPKMGGFDKYEVEGAADTIMKAHEHMANHKLMAQVHKHLAKKGKAIKKSIRSIADLKAAKAQMDQEDQDEGQE